MRYLSITIGLLLLLSQPAMAGEIVYELFLGQETNIESLIGAYKGGQSGASIATGDLDGDGVEDWAVGSPFASVNEKRWNGAVDIYLEGGNKKLTYVGKNSGDQLGTKLVFGDFNNDGVDDMAVSAFNAYHIGKRPGEVYIFYGGSQWGRQEGSQERDLLYFKPDLTLTGWSTKGGFGLELSTGDINNDDIDDLLVGIPFASTGNVPRSGKVNAYLGKETGLSNRVDTILRGQYVDERFGSSIATGDIDGDSKDNIVIGAYYGSVGEKEQAGRIYIYDYVNEGNVITKPAVQIDGTKEKAWFGFDIAIGDLTGDEVEDIAVSSFPYHGNKDDAQVTILNGSKDQLPRNISNIERTPFSNSLLGASLHLADLDMDERQDIVVGAPGVGEKADTGSGHVHVFYANGKKAVIEGVDEGDWFGSSIDSFDFNGDGYFDLLIGARYADGGKSANNGEVILLKGNGIAFGESRIISTDNYIRRDEFISTVINKLDLKNRHAKELSECREYVEFCLFNFMAMSDYDGIDLEGELKLYPDIYPHSQYYDEITTATMLGIMQGYLNEEGSPFHPERPISRVQALKVILESLDLVDPKFRFELVNSLGSVEKLGSQFSYFPDVDAKISHMWWYPRYVNYAVEKMIVRDTGLFRPDDNITMAELDNMIIGTLDHIARINEEINARGDKGDEALSLGSESEG